MGVIEQLIRDVRTWRSLVAGRVELSSRPGERLPMAARSGPAAIVGTPRVGSHPPQAA